MKNLLSAVLIFFVAGTAFTEARIDITSAIDWNTMQIKADVSLDLASAGIRLPSGRTQAEFLLSAGYSDLIRSSILNIQADSSSTIGELIERGEITLSDAGVIAANAAIVPPAYSSDLQRMFSSYTITLSGISSVLSVNTRAVPVPRTLTPVSTAQYTGIIIIAANELPVYGHKTEALPVPCLFPKIWDSGMNLIYERRMLEARNKAMVHYFPLKSIFQNNPSALSPELRDIVGDKPLRIFAKGVFGINPSDLIIDSDDAMLIISSDENRRLLSQGKVAFILSDSVLHLSY
ncbi:MAG: polymerase [Treponema sp.]|nr:polymerase [Treponema sp.]MCL2271909.1 polymerase [Treponema sp.]